jgi:rhodanese-related sulfurtransferase
VTVLTGAPDREHFMPNAKALMLKLIVDRISRRLLGVQVAGPGQGDKRIDVATTAITAGMTVDQISNLDLCYAPPYSLAMDNLITGANIAKNKLAGVFESITPMEVYAKMQNREDFVLLDVSTPHEYEEMRLPGSMHIPSGALRSRLSDIPKDREIVTFCRLSIRGYEAALILQAAGFQKVRVMDGGVMMWPYEKVHGMK